MAFPDRTLLVSPLPSPTTHEDVRRHFANTGASNIFMFNNQGRHALVSFETAEEAASRAVATPVLRIRNVVVPVRRIDVAHSVWVSGLVPTIRAKDMRKHFSAFGLVTHVRVTYRVADTIGLVIFSTDEAAHDACAARHELGGAKLVARRPVGHRSTPEKSVASIKGGASSLCDIPPRDWPLDKSVWQDPLYLVIRELWN